MGSKLLSGKRPLAKLRRGPVEIILVELHCVSLRGAGVEAVTAAVVFVNDDEARKLPRWQLQPSDGLHFPTRTGALSAPPQSLSCAHHCRSVNKAELYTKAKLDHTVGPSEHYRRSREPGKMIDVLVWLAL